MRRRRALDGLEDDIRDHIERETRENIERGMTEEAARAAARRRFGNVAHAMEETRAVWQRAWLEELLQDARYGGRFLRRNPRFASVVVLTLGLGIGMTTAVFSVVNTVLLKPLDYPDSKRLVWLANDDPNVHHDIIWGPDYRELREHAPFLGGMVGYGYEQAAIATARGAVQVTGVHIDGDFWRLTGARPALGRLCRDGEQDCLVIAWSLFQRQFGGDAGAVGHQATMNGRPATVAGVLPPTFRFQFPMWWTEAHPEPVDAYWPMPPVAQRLPMGCQAVALLQPGTSLPRAQTELQALQTHIHDGRPDLSAHIRIEPLEEKLAGSSRGALLLLLAAGGFVLLIACVNIANLLLARATARQKEVAIRAAVGAGRWRVIRQLLVESVLQALAGGLVGLLFARWAISALVRISPFALPRLAETFIDARVLAFTLLVSVLTGVLFGAGPAVSLWRANLHEALKSGGRNLIGISGMHTRRLLVAVEMALAIVLLTGAGLMVKSFARMSAHPPGFVPDQVIVMKAWLAGAQRLPRPVQEAHVGEVLQQIEATPGVSAAGISTWFLWGGQPAYPTDADQTKTHVIHIRAMSPDYLKAMGVRLIRGRWLTDGDSSAMLLNQSMAREAFGAADPLGRQFASFFQEKATIVGIVEDVKYSKLDATPPAEVYVPLRRSPMLGSLEIAATARGNPSELIAALPRRVAAIDPMQPVYDVKTLDQALADSIAPRRFNLFLLGAFAAAALLMALVGIYGVIAWSVAERTGEIGLRMALGARRGQVAGMVVREGVTIALLGIGAGLASAWALSRLMTSLLYEVKASDPAVFMTVAGALAAGAVAACVVPAVRAASTDPNVSLRYE